MKLIIAGGTGQVGRLLLRAFAAAGDECVVLTRRPRVGTAAGNVREVAWDGRTLGPWIGELDGADVVINLAGRSVDCRYSEANLEAMMSSRVESTRVVGAAIARAARPPAVWLQASTATIYAHRYDAPNDERHGIIGGREAGVPALWCRSIAIAEAWEAELMSAPTPLTRKVALRSAMVMSPDAGGVFDRLAGLSATGVGRQGDGRQFISWIHEEDFVAAVRFLIGRPDLSGAVNVAAPHPLPNAEFMAALRQARGGRVALPIPRWALAVGAFLLRTETELILKSRRVVPGRLLAAGFEFRYPMWPEAAANLVQGRALAGKSGKATTGLKRPTRIVIELFGPPFFGAAVMVTGEVVAAVGSGVRNGMNSWRNLFLGAAIVLLFGYVLAGIPSIVYTAIMEWRFSRGLDPKSWRVVGWSAGLGAIAGLAIPAFLGGTDAQGIQTFGGTGLVVGIMLGGLIRALSRRV